jgi:hypothetical protein
MTSPINTTFLKLSKRAETSARETLIHTFVDVGPLFTILSSRDHQILFGRRGTGKTHALNYLANDREKDGDAVAMVDLRNIGSNGGLYADASRPLQERATGLLVDVLGEIHDSLYQFFVNRAEELNFAEAGPAFDSLAEAITQVQVVGEVQQEVKADQATKVSDEESVSAKMDVEGVHVSLSSAAERVESSGRSLSERRTGTEHLHVNFGSTGAALRRLADLLKPHRLWLLLDEWSSIPTALQPYLADLLRRSAFPISGITVKIAAIEHRSEFRLPSKEGGYIGQYFGHFLSGRG